VLQSRLAGPAGPWIGDLGPRCGRLSVVGGDRRLTCHGDRAAETLVGAV